MAHLHNITEISILEKARFKIHASFWCIGYRFLSQIRNYCQQKKLFKKITMFL